MHHVMHASGKKPENVQIPKHFGITSRRKIKFDELEDII